MGVEVTVGVLVKVGVNVSVGVEDWVGVSLGVEVAEGVNVDVGVKVRVHEPAVAVRAVTVMESCSWADGPHPATMMQVETSRHQTKGNENLYRMVLANWQ